MANNIYQDLLRQTREEIARNGLQAQEQERNRRRQEGIPSVRIEQTQPIGASKPTADFSRIAKNTAVSGIRGAYIHAPEQKDTEQAHPRTDREYGAAIGQLNTDIYYANKLITDYTALRNSFGMSGEEADEAIQRQMKQLLADNGYSTFDEAKQKLESMQAKKWTLEQERRYLNLESNPDFEEKSKPATDKATASNFGLLLGETWVGKGDKKYDYINNLEGARGPSSDDPEFDEYSAGNTQLGIYRFMKPEEISRYNYLYNTHGKDAAEEYLEYLKYTLSERRAEDIRGISADFANKVPVVSDATSVIAKLGSGIGLVDSGIQGAWNSAVSAVTGETEKPIDYYRNAGPSISTATIRGTRAQNLANDYGVIDINAEDHPILAKVLNGKSLGDLYQLGMSLVDSLAAGKLTKGLGKAGTVLLGGSAGTQAMLDAVAKGATDDQAITMGILNAAAEIIFESYEVDNLLGSSSNILKSVANQALTEAIGESATTISNTIADILVMQDKSEFMQNVQKYMEKGMTKEKAQLAAFGDAAIALGWDAIGGAVSGGLFGLAGPNVSGANDTNRNSDFTVEEAGESGDAPAGNAASQTFQQNQQQAAQPQVAQQPATQQATQQRESSAKDTVAAALNYYNENGRVSNSVADKVLADPAAVQELQRGSGVKIPGITEGATHSQKRSAVKSAIAQLSGVKPEITQQGAVDTFVDSMQEIQEGNPGSEAAQEQTGGTANEELDAAIGPALRGERPGNSVDSVQPGQYNNRRSDQVSGVIDRLNRGGTDSPSIDEIMAIPEIAEAEKANDGTETINLPDREQIRNAGYQQAMQKGSWNGTDYSGPVRQERRMDIVIGLPGSGKSSVYTERLSHQYGSRVIDTDDFREYIPEYNGSNASVVHEEASEIRDRVFEAALDKGDNVLLSTIGANANKLEAQIARYRQLGYSVYLHLNELPNSKSISRAIGRYISEDGSLGRYVSPKLIEAYGDKPTQTYLYLTGQGGTENGELGSDLRTGRGQSSENAGQNAGTQEGSAAGSGEGLLAGYDWYNNDVARGERPRLVQSSEQSPGIKGTGAAERNFSGKADYQELLYEGNVQRDRPGDVRPMEVPKKDSYGRNVSEFVGNAYGADVTPDSMASEIEMLVQEGALGFDKKTNHEALQEAAQAIRKKGPMATMKSITKSISNGKLRDGDIEKAMLLYARYANMDFEKNPDAKDNASELMVDLTTMAHMSGRNLQLFSMFRRMAPEGQLMTVQKTIQRSVENLIKNGKVKKDYVPSIESQLQENYLKAAREAQKAKTPGDVEAARQKLKAAENAIILSEAAKIPATFKAKWDAWRYMGMLGNAKTQIRNVAGNAAYIPYKAAKDAIGAAMELAIPKEQRTKAIMNLASKADRDLLSWAMADGKSGQVQDALKYSAKLGDDVSGDVIRQNMRIFNTEALEAVRKAVEWAPSFGDMVFKNHYYANSLAGFLKARGYSIQDVMDGKVSDGVFQEARSYAIQEAMKATFNDCNAFSDFIVNLRYKGDNPVGKAMNLLGEGVIPFRRTPANIVMRAVDNSPVSIVRGAVNLATKVRNGQMSAATAIDQMASGLTGSGAMLLGFALASGILGIKLRGSGTDDDEKRRGIQDYSIEFSIGGKDYSYTIDWAAPANFPLFVGANIYEAFNEREWDTGISKFSKVIYAMGDTLEPMLSLSCLSSLNDIIESSRYAEDNKAIITVLSQAAFSYFTQGVPALLRQTVQAAHQNKQITFANNQDPLLREAERKIGGVALLGEFFRTDKINQWGETESAGGGLRRIIDAYFNPGTLKEIDTSDLESEIERLNSSQPDSVSPPDAAKTITYTDASGNRHENYRLTEEEYSNMARMQGNTARRILDEIISGDSYGTFTDAQKAKVFGYVYDYAREKGRIEAIDGYTGNLASWMEDADGGEAGAVIRKVIESDFSDAFYDLTDGGDNAAEALGRAYDGYKGLTFDDKKIFRENATGRVKWMIDAGAAGMDAETFAGMYQQYRDIDGSDKGISQKANAWAYALQNAYERGDITKKQMQILKKDMVFRYSGVVDTPKFDSMVEAGVGGDDAKKVVDLLAGLKPESGYKDVRDIQNAEAIAGSGLSDGDTVEALYAYLPNAQDENLREMLGMGFSAEDYVRAWRMYDGASGKGKKQRTIDQYQKAFGVDYSTAKMIYEVYG